MKKYILAALAVLLVIIVITPARYTCSNGYEHVYITVNKILRTYSVTPLHAYSNKVGARVHDFTDRTSYIEDNGKEIPIDKVELKLWNEVLLAQQVYDTGIDKTAVNELLLNTYTLRYSYGFYFDYPGNSENDKSVEGTCNYNILNSIFIF